jgi:excisionase family DNA binding protein
VSDWSASLTREIAEQVVELLHPELVQALASAPADEPWRLLNLEEAAARLGRSTRWVRDRVSAGELPHVRLDGGAFAFEVADLRAFAAERRIDAAAGVLADRLHGARGARAGAVLRSDPQPHRLRLEHGAR